MDDVAGHGVLVAYGPCYLCGTLFSFNPETVPSWPPGPNAEPICRPCIEKVNAARAVRGHDEFRITDDMYPVA